MKVILVLCIGVLLGVFTVLLLPVLLATWLEHFIAYRCSGDQIADEQDKTWTEQDNAFWESVLKNLI